MYGPAMYTCCQHALGQDLCMGLPCTHAVNTLSDRICVWACHVHMLSTRSRKGSVYGPAMYTCCQHALGQDLCMGLPCTHAVNKLSDGICVWACHVHMRSTSSRTGSVYGPAMYTCCQHALGQDLGLDRICVWACHVHMLSTRSRTGSVYGPAMYTCCQHALGRDLCVGLPCTHAVNMLSDRICVWACHVHMLSTRSRTGSVYGPAMYTCCQHALGQDLCMGLPCTHAVNTLSDRICVWACHVHMLSTSSRTGSVYGPAMYTCGQQALGRDLCMGLPCTHAVNTLSDGICVWACHVHMLSTRSRTGSVYGPAMYTCCQHALGRDLCMGLPCTHAVNMLSDRICVWACHVHMLSTSSRTGSVYGPAMYTCCQQALGQDLCMGLPCTHAVNTLSDRICVWACHVHMLSTSSRTGSVYGPAMYTCCQQALGHVQDLYMGLPCTHAAILSKRHVACVM